MSAPRSNEENSMKRFETTLPEIGLIAGTRVILGAGIALLLSDHLSREKRRAIGGTLLAVGILTTIPLVLDVAGKLRVDLDDA
jgi:hypothetical protein